MSQDSPYTDDVDQETETALARMHEEMARKLNRALPIGEGLAAIIGPNTAGADAPKELGTASRRPVRPRRPTSLRVARSEAVAPRGLRAANDSIAGDVPADPRVGDDLDVTATPSLRQRIRDDIHSLQLAARRWPLDRNRHWRPDEAAQRKLRNTSESLDALSRGLDQHALTKTEATKLIANIHRDFAELVLKQKALEEHRRGFWVATNIVLSLVLVMSSTGVTLMGSGQTIATVISISLAIFALFGGICIAVEFRRRRSRLTDSSTRSAILRLRDNVNKLFDDSNDRRTTTLH
jgi:hypothetical protein